ncbi:glycosyltransferase family 2 protein [Spirosoma fluviale]|uniref:Glycosyltransferase involved in cell wall bisynthesis n=1 Tax=Spirosoma fluviale TaxID=1597977 RepID=A0A286GS12_9BACT|nr:glycosyltransferase family 2 protein [Spirosoma fluviale]SOD98323.1 Glycosyltransferase involved in cell wall bisynthesis [Spirosoma fluviale]
MITVVIPLYNKAHTIVETLGSVLKQSFTEFEVILVNDGSTDNSTEVITKKFSDGRIKVINQTNQGVSVARNVGVANARYEYIAFLDGDDLWLPGYLATMAKAIKLYPKAGMFCCAGIVRNSDKVEILRTTRKYMKKIVEINFFENPHVFLHTSATIVSRIEFNKTKGFPLGMKRNQDFALFFSLALITQVVYCGFPLSVYVGGVEGQTTSNFNSSVLLHKANRYNYVYDNWISSGANNKDFIIFMKYELRHGLYSLIKKNGYKDINLFLDNLSKGVISQFLPMELALYKDKYLKFFAISFIVSTKIRWKMRGYPVVGEAN